MDVFELQLKNFQFWKSAEYEPDLMILLRGINTSKCFLGIAKKPTLPRFKPTKGNILKSGSNVLPNLPIV